MPADMSNAVQSIAHHALGIEAGKLGSSLKKVDDDQRLVYGEVYAPGIPDAHGDFMSAQTIQDMAHEFLRRGLVNNVDVDHNNELSGCYIVESFIAREGDGVFIPGSWVVGVKVPDDKLWKKIKTGELNGFSLEGSALRVDADDPIEYPNTLTGETDLANGHSHTFQVWFDDEGKFLGGETGPGPDGHVHRITRGTLTDKVNGHAHRFSFVEVLLDAQVGEG